MWEKETLWKEEMQEVNANHSEKMLLKMINLTHRFIFYRLKEGLESEP